MAWLEGLSAGGVNPTGVGTTSGTTVTLLPPGPGLKNSVNICGDTTSKSLAAGVVGTGVRVLSCESEGEEAVKLLVGAGLEGDCVTATLGAAEFVFAPAISTEFVAKGLFKRTAGSVNDATFAIARENRSGDGPVFRQIGPVTACRQRSEQTQPHGENREIAKIYRAHDITIFFGNERKCTHLG